MTWVTTQDATRLYVRVQGAGRPVILMHGWPLSADSWAAVTPPLVAAGYRVIAYDRRGFGRSDRPTHGYDYRTLADDLRAVIAATDAHDAAIVGFSMGGGEVARYMSRHGGAHVSQAVLVASVVPYLLRTPDTPHGIPLRDFTAIARRLSDDRAPFFAEFFAQFFYGGADGHALVSDAVLRWSSEVAMQASPHAVVACLLAFAQTDFRRDLASFGVPTLIVHGTADRAVPIDASARPTAAAIANAMLREYAGAPHGLLATHTDRFVADLLAFLGTHAARSGGAG